MKEQLYLFNY